MKKLRSKGKFILILSAVLLIVAAGTIVYLSNPTFYSMLFPILKPTINSALTSTINPIPSSTIIKQTEYTLEYFKSTHENSIIIASGLAYMDDDDIKDYIILYQKEYYEKTTLSNVCIMTADRVLDVDIAGGDTNFYYAYDDKSLVIDPESLIASIYLYDEKEDRVLEYHLKVTHDAEKHSINVKIDANEVKP